MIKIEQASREGAKVVIGLAGVSGSGKTYTALQLAYGLAKGNAGKIGFLDTENRRGRLYSDILPNGAKFNIGDLVAPFSPQRYMDAIAAFEQAGCEVLVIDSGSHEWEGPGGCEDIAHEGNPKQARWNKAKREHKRFVTAMLQSSMHIILCLRAREKVKIERGERGESVFIPLGLQPITEKNLMFEMTASVMMQDEGRSQTVLKCPEALRAFLGRGNNYLTAKDGAAVRAWIDGGTPVNRELERVRATLANTCEGGMAALEAAWKGLTAEQRKALQAELPALKASAQGYDAQREIAGTEDSSEATEAATAALMGEQQKNGGDDDASPWAN